VWLAAGPPGPENAPHGVLLRVRDAVSQLARVCFDVRDTDHKAIPIMLGWDPTVVPLVLDVARRFVPSGGHLVFVTVTDSQAQHDARILALADWSRGLLVKSAIDSERRNAMKTAGFSGAVFIGGGQDVQEDSRAIGTSAGPLFAVGSTGGVAASLLHVPGTTYCGGGAIPYEVMRDTRSYVTLMRKIRESVTGAQATPQATP
jgi:hypothetical protein